MSSKAETTTPDIWILWPLALSVPATVEYPVGVPPLWMGKRTQRRESTGPRSPGPTTPTRDTRTIRVKMVLLGSSGVGKSSLAIRFSKDEFKGTLPTVGCEYTYTWYNSVSLVVLGWIHVYWYHMHGYYSIMLLVPKVCIYFCGMLFQLCTFSVFQELVFSYSSILFYSPKLSCLSGIFCQEHCCSVVIWIQDRFAVRHLCLVPCIYIFIYFSSHSF